MEISFSEMIVLGLIAFIVLGPKELVKHSQQLGRLFSKLQREFNSFKAMAQEEILKSPKTDLATEILTNPALSDEVKTGIQSELKSVQETIQNTLENRVGRGTKISQSETTPQAVAGVEQENKRASAEEPKAGDGEKGS